MDPIRDKVTEEDLDTAAVELGFRLTNLVIVREVKEAYKDDPKHAARRLIQLSREARVQAVRFEKPSSG